MIENSNFQVGLKRAAEDGNAVTLMKENGLMRTAGKRFLQVMVVGAGPLSDRTDIIVSDKVGFLPSSGGTAEILRSLSCIDRGQRRFLFLEELS